MRSLMLCLLCFILVAACEAEPTPFPVDVPVTPTPTLSPTEMLPIRYALLNNLPIPESDLQMIEAGHLVEYLNAPIDNTELGARFDIIVAYGEYPGWTRSDITSNVMLVIDPASEPLEIRTADIIRRAINPQQIVEGMGISGVSALTTGIVGSSLDLKADLANLGKPDGVGVVVGSESVPGADLLAAQLAAINIQTREISFSNGEIPAAFNEGLIQLGLVTWVTPQEHQVWLDMFSPEWTIDLYNLPISYLALPELNITLTPGGFPLASR